MTGRSFHRATQAIPRRPWKAKSPFASRPISNKHKKGRARGAREVQRGTSWISFPSCGAPVVQSYWPRFKEDTWNPLLKGRGSGKIRQQRFDSRIEYLTRSFLNVYTVISSKILPVLHTSCETSPAIYRVQNPENPESLKKSLPRVWDHRSRTPTKSKKIRKVKEIDDFLTFS